MDEVQNSGGISQPFQEIMTDQKCMCGGSVRARRHCSDCLLSILDSDQSLNLRTMVRLTQTLDVAFLPEAFA